MAKKKKFDVTIKATWMLSNKNQVAFRGVKLKIKKKGKKKGAAVNDFFAGNWRQTRSSSAGEVYGSPFKLKKGNYIMEIKTSRGRAPQQVRFEVSGSSFNFVSFKVED